MTLNLRCIYCQTPFTISHPAVLEAIIIMNEKHQTHYDAHCVKCRRANSISRERMEIAYPNWQNAAKHAPAPDEAPAVTGTVSATSKTEPLPKEKKAATVKKAPAKTAAKTKAPSAGKTAASEPKVKKAPEKGKK